MSQRIFIESVAGSLQFIGDFEGLYEDELDPWEQSGRTGPKTRYYGHSRQTLIQALTENQARGCGVEIGCGHGHLTARLQGALRTQVIGMDISGSAIDTARRINPQCKFVAGDIMLQPLSRGGYGFVVWAQCLWYLLHGIDAAIENTLAGIQDGGLFIVSQAFLRDQKYGREIADGFHGALRLFTEIPGLTLIDARYDDAGTDGLYDGLMIFRKNG